MLIVEVNIILLAIKAFIANNRIWLELSEDRPYVIFEYGLKILSSVSKCSKCHDIQMFTEMGP